MILVRAVLMNYGKRSVRVRRKHVGRGRIEAGAVDAGADRQSGDYFASLIVGDTAITPLRHPLNNLWWAVSMAIATGCLQGAVDQRRVTVAVFASISTTSLVSVRFA